MTLLIIALPALDLRLGLPDDSVAGPSTTQRKAYDLLAAGFGPGFNGPLTVVLDAAGVADPNAAAPTVASDIRALGDVLFVAPAVFNDAGDTAILNVIPKSAPSSAETVQLVTDLRAAAPRSRPPRVSPSVSPARRPSSSISRASWVTRCCPTCSWSSGSRSCCSRSCSDRCSCR